jgi:hypothetical protein
MPRGHFLSKDVRKRLFYLFFYENRSAEFIHNQLFFAENIFITGDIRSVPLTLETVKNHCRHLSSNRDNLLALEIYLNGPLKRGGRNSKLSVFNHDYLLHIFCDRSRRIYTLRRLHTEFCREVFGVDANGSPSQTTISKAVHDKKFTPKVVERRHIYVDEVERLDFFERIANIDPWDIIDIDETASSPEQFRRRWIFCYGQSVHIDTDCSR